MNNYQNPSNLPIQGAFEWVPNEVPTGGIDVSLGFRYSTLDRGHFRNDIPWLTISNSGNPGTDASCITTPLGLQQSALLSSEDWPILAAVRPMQAPWVNVGAATAGAYVSSYNTVTNDDIGWQIDFTGNNINSNPVQHMSCCVIEYALIVNLLDQNLATCSYLTEQDQSAIVKWQSNPTASGSGVKWSNYIWGRVQTFSGAQCTGTGTPFSGLAVTGEMLDSTTFVPMPTTQTIRFITSAIQIPQAPEVSSFKIDSAHPGFTFLTLYLWKTMFFNAKLSSGNDARVNFPLQVAPGIPSDTPTDMLPASYFEYAYPVSFNFSPNIYSSVYPINALHRPNFHLKIYSPEERIGSIGLSHSIFLEFVCLWSPIIGVSPSDATSLIGILSSGDLSGNYSLFLFMFGGPAVGTRTLNLVMLNSPITLAPGMVIPLDYIPYPTNTKSLQIQKVVGSNTTSTPPASNANWINIGPLVDPSNPPPTHPLGPFVSALLYYDTAGTQYDWYRIEQVYNNGVYYSDPFQGQVYSEETVFAMTDPTNVISNNPSSLITRHINLLSNGDPLKIQHPLILFRSDADYPFANPITFDQGVWSISLRAYVTDTNIEPLTNTHLFARFWFHPASQKVDPNNPYAYRNSTTEIYFDSKSTNRIALGTPATLDQCLVSAPISVGTNLTPVDMRRYCDSVEGALGENFSPFKNDQATLVMALYTVSYPLISGDINASTSPYPTITVEINQIVDVVQTTLFQVLSHTLYPTSAQYYGSSQYVAYTQNLCVTNQLVGGKNNAPDVSGFVKYSQHFTTSSSGVATAFNNLMILEASTSSIPPAKFYLPYGPLAGIDHSNNSAIYADFVTNGATLALGRVVGGPTNWQINLTLDYDIIDLPTLVDFDIKLEGFLVTVDGAIIEYVFRTDYINSSAFSGTGALQQSISTVLTYEIGGEDTQFVLRLWVYPYWANPSSPASNATQIANKLVAKPFGFRVNNLTIAKNSIMLLSLPPNDNPGTPSWYENLPTTPAVALSSDQFWFEADASLLNSSIIGSSGITINGAMYSPAWLLDPVWPTGMEIECLAEGLTNQFIALRTVPASAQGVAPESGVSAIEHPYSGDIHIATSQQNTSVNSLSVASDVTEMAFTGQALRHIILEHPYALPISDALISGNNSNTSYTMEGRDPSLIWVRDTGASAKRGATLSVLAQVDEQNGSSYTVATNYADGRPESWSAPIPDDQFGTLRRVAQGLKHPAVIESDNCHLLYAAGYCNPGTYLIKEVGIFDVSSDGPLPPGDVYIIDGNANPILPGNQTFTLPAGGVNGTAVDTFPAVAIDKNGRLVCAYVLQEYSGDIYTRIREVGQAFGVAYQTVSFRQFGLAGNTNMSIYGVTLAEDYVLSAMYVSFWCSGKIFVTSVNINTYAQNVQLPQIFMAAGNTDFTQTSNPMNASFDKLIKSGYLGVNPTSPTTETDVPKQRIGFCVSNVPPNQGNLLIYYKNSQNQLCERIMQPYDGLVTPPFVIPSLPSNNLS